MLEEAKDNIKRLGHHPSIVHWCGNNEINVAWHNWGWQDTYKIKKRHQKVLYKNYEDIFLSKLPNLLHKWLPAANYSHTSPLSNWDAEENFDHSSMHYWGVFHGEDPFEDYGANIGRFNSEYGFQTFPNINVIEEYFKPEEFDLEDPLLAHRQKSYKGNRLIYQHIEDYYPMPTSMLELSYLSQLTQAKGIEMAITAHRLNTPRCMGTLYWQLNDCWPAVSWSSLDYNGQWKALHYAVQKAYKPSTLFVNKENTRISLINDGPEEQRVKILYKDDKGTPLLSHYNIKLNTRESKELIIPGNLLDGKDWIEVVMSTDSLEVSKVIVSSNIKLRPVGDDNLEMTLTRTKDGSKLVLKSKVLIKSLYLYSDCAIHYSQNFFDLLPHRTYEVLLTPFGGKDLNGLEIKHISLNNLKNEQN